MIFPPSSEPCNSPGEGTYGRVALGLSPGSKPTLKRGFVVVLIFQKFLVCSVSSLILSGKESSIKAYFCIC